MTISFTQKEAGFVNQINEEVLEVKMDAKTYHAANTLKKYRVVEGKEEVILGDTPAKLMKLHQIYSGLVSLSQVTIKYLM